MFDKNKTIKELNDTSFETILGGCTVTKSKEGYEVISDTGKFIDLAPTFEEGVRIGKTYELNKNLNLSK